jgi:hypothetical protein
MPFHWWLDGAPMHWQLRPSRSSGLSANDDSKLPNDYLVLFIQSSHNSDRIAQEKPISTNVCELFQYKQEILNECCTTFTRGAISSVLSEIIRRD